MRIIILSIFVIVLLCGCKEKISFVEEVVFVKLEISSNSAEYYIDHFPSIITVRNEGEIRLFTESTADKPGDHQLYVGATEQLKNAEFIRL